MELWLMVNCLLINGYSEILKTLLHEDLTLHSTELFPHKDQETAKPFDLMWKTREKFETMKKRTATNYQTELKVSAQAFRDIVMRVSGGRSLWQVSVWSGRPGARLTCFKLGSTGSRASVITELSPAQNVVGVTLIRIMCCMNNTATSTQHTLPRC